MRSRRVVLLLVISLMASTLSSAQHFEQNPASQLRAISLDGWERSQLITQDVQVLQDSDRNLELKDVQARVDWQLGDLPADRRAI
jgi:hypothetical protein